MNFKIAFLISLVGASSAVVFAEESIQDHLLVVGQQPTYLHHLDNVLPVTKIDVSDAATTGSAADIFALAPQINFNGQGGLLQTISIRGLSRWRIQTLVEGVPIHTERRAGNAAEFIAPGMIGGAYILPGAASTQLGSGALGGGVDVQLAATLDTQVVATTGTQQDYRSLDVRGGTAFEDSDLYWGVTSRHGNNGKDGLGQSILNGFEQSVGWLRHVSDQKAVKDALVVVSRANNAGKASADLPEDRTTDYPDNHHWLAKIDLDWLNTRVYAHNADLHTDINRPGRRQNLLENRALGWGASIGDGFKHLDWLFNWRASLDARSAVEAQEQELNADGDLVFSRTNLDASQRAWSLALDGVRRWQSIELATGLRFEHMQQRARAMEVNENKDSNISAFVAAKTQWTDNWKTGLYLSSAYRVPTLTERYFNGSTPRGVTLGDPELQTERARNMQVELAYQNRNLALTISAFRQRIDNYIERVALTDSLQQYVNLGDAKIDGVTYQSRWSALADFYVQANGQWLWGEDETGAPINDVSPHQHSLQLGMTTDSREFWINATYRQRHDRVGSSESLLDSVLFFRAGMEILLTNALTASLLINNLTDKDYPMTTDDLSPLAMGRDIQFGLRYTF